MIALQQEMEQRKKSQQELQGISEERGVLLKEIHHRVKNNLQVISSMLSLQKRSENDPRVIAALSESQRRIATIATTHQFVYQSRDLASVESREFFTRIISQTVESLGDSSQQINISKNLDNLRLDFDRAITCAQILSELLSNIFKHAFPENRPGQIWISLQKQASGRIRLTVADDGVGFNSEEHRDSSLGLRLIQALADKLRGELSFVNEQGAKISLSFPEEIHE
jgi:two-component sensor histidine kinase